MAIIQGNAKQGSTRGFYPKTIEGSLRFNDDDSAYLEWTPDSAGTSSTIWTFSWWQKSVGLNNSGTEVIFGAADGSNRHMIRFDGSGQLEFVQYTTTVRVPTAKFRDPSAWYHFVVNVNGSSAAIYVNGEEITDFTTSNSPSGSWYIGNQYTHRIGRDPANADYQDGYLAEVFFIDGTAHNADAFGETKNGVWVPKNITATDFTMGTNGFHLTFQDDTAVEAFNTVLYRGNGNVANSITGVGFQPDLVWAKRRDANNYNHILNDSVRGPKKSLVSNDTGAELYNRGIESFDADGFSFLNTNANNEDINGADDKIVAWCWDAGANNAITGHSSVTWQGDDADNREISGFPFTPDLIWIGPRTFNGANKQIYDSVRGFGLGKDLISNGISAEGAESPAYGGIQSVTKYGFKTKSGSSGGGLEDAQINMYQNATYYPGITGEYVAWGWDAGDGDAVTDTSGTNVSSVTRKTSTANGFSIIDYTVTSANNSATKLVPHGLGGNPDWMMIKKYTNNASDNQRWAVYHSALEDDQFLKLGDEATDGAGTASSVFDDSSFTTDTFAVGSSGMVGGHPSFDESYICYAWKAVSGKSAFGTYTGTGSSQTIQTGFRVGWLMIKATSTSGQSWFMIDGSRSPFNNGDVQFLAADTSGIEQGSSVNDVDFHETDGFTVKGTGNLTNGTLVKYVYMAFKGSYSDYITDYNTDGDIDSRVKANDTYGFSIVSYTGNGNASQTVGHGLGSAPSSWFVILKNRTNNSTDWPTFHSSIPSGRLKLNTDDNDFGNYPITFNTDTITLPSVNDLAWSSSNADYIAYCWAEKSGYSKFGSYTGNGSSVTVYTTDDGTAGGANGFKPAWILIKRFNQSAANTNWEIHDNTRNTGEELLGVLYPNTAGAEGFNNPGSSITTTDNSFTVNGSGGSINGNNDSYLYAAFADTREAAFWLDQSGNDNDWQTVNLDHNDTVADSPTDNFATINPLGTSSFTTLSDGNLRAYGNSASNNGNASFTISPNTGQWYFEYTALGSDYPYFVNSSDISKSINNGGGAAGWNGSKGLLNLGASSGDTIGVAVNYDTNTAKFYVNGVYVSGQDLSLDNPADGGGLMISNYNGSAAVMNFGQQPFKYDPPA
jgi:hypothetical protein